MTAASDIDRLSYHREVNEKSGALLGRTFNPNLARMLLNNSVGDRKAKASAAFLPFRDSALGGEERIVNAMDMLLRDSRSAVGNNNADSIAI
jgi:hypothetical protein